MKLAGRCHCGNLSVEFETGYEPASLPLRACQCSFCRAHGAVTSSDARGQLRLQARDGSAVQRYRFGLGLTDFILCRRCGTYLAALMDIDGGLYGVVNANVLERRAELRAAPEAMHYDDEDAASRAARRKLRWTPVTAMEGL